jgi:dihydropteroate synthase
MLADETGKPAPTDQRLSGSMASIAVGVLKGAHIVRVHDVKETVEFMRVLDAIKQI